MSSSYAKTSATLRCPDVYPGYLMPLVPLNESFPVMTSRTTGGRFLSRKVRVQIFHGNTLYQDHSRNADPVKLANVSRSDNPCYNTMWCKYALPVVVPEASSRSRGRYTISSCDHKSLSSHITGSSSMQHRIGESPGERDPDPRFPAFRLLFQKAIPLKSTDGGRQCLCG